MKKLITVFAAGSAAATLGIVGSAANAATATADATAEILQQVQIAKTADLNFGTIVPDSTASGNVNVAANAAGTRTCAANLTCAGATSVSSAAFDVTGANGLNVDVTGIGSLTQLSDGANTMPISLSASSNVLAMTGSAVALYVGGDLTIGVNQPAGVYSGSFTVNVDYQ
ncbi:DUF4402 domain-containing protein [Parasphingopyxis algicola]|uniref:DUF4402 domain-containing protein n=1 Tax=Parasphingopyxis algicola TaxID=2026624 RepID=UPI0015A2F75D|nr:DUF4402 domain-containing protein [Parasphingopyxis algicola]QLC25619.1 DUF4402 domain-containing protein [Parasphingopyxis algicola]